MADADRLDRAFVWPHLWWRHSLFAGEGLHSLGWHLNTLIEGHTLLFFAFLSHTVSVHLSLLSPFLPLSLSLPGLLWQIQAVGGGAGTLFPSLPVPLSFSLFLTHAHRSTPPTHGVIINTSPISIFHTVCLEKPESRGWGGLRESQGC